MINDLRAARKPGAFPADGVSGAHAAKQNTADHAGDKGKSGQMECASDKMHDKKQEKLSVVGITSVTAQYGSIGNAAYAASKGALISLIKSLASEYAGQKIRFNCICPGYIETPMLDSIKRLYKTEEEFREAIVKKHALGLGSPEDIAAAAAYLLSDAAKWVTGSVMNVDGGYLK